MIKKEHLQRILFTAVVSVVICTLANVLFFDTPITASMILKSVGVGIAIWLVSEISFEAVSRRWPHHILPSYLVLFIIIGVGTGFGLWILGMTAIGAVLIICASAEICGFTIAVIYRGMYKRRLSRQLEKFNQAH